MPWTDVVTSRTDSVYRAAIGLARLVSDADLAWRPATGSNWMTVGQLLEHMKTAGGTCVRGFVTGDWSALGADGGDTLPSAATMPSVRSVADAVAGLEADRRVALESVAKAGEAALATKRVAAPWDPTEKPLGQHCLEMVDAHLGTHKAQLFYYLKLMGKPVHTGHLYAM